MSQSFDEEYPRIPDDQPEPDAHGEAALTLAEAMLHGLVEREIISVGDAIAIADSARDTQLAIADDRRDPSKRHPYAVRLLAAIGASLRIDADPRDKAPPEL